MIGKDKSHPMWKQYPQAPDEIVFRIMREPEQRVTALLNNEIQIAQFVPPHLRERVERSANHKIVKFHTAELMFLAMMPKVKPWDNKLVRQAVAYAIDRDMIIKTLLRGEASRLDGPIGDGQYGYDPNLQPKYTYNPEKAKELLKQAGYPNGVDVELQTPVGRYTLDKQLSEAMIPMLNAAGFRAKLATPEWATCGPTCKWARCRSTTWAGAAWSIPAQRSRNISKPAARRASATRIPRSTNC